MFAITVFIPNCIVRNWLRRRPFFGRACQAASASSLFKAITILLTPRSRRANSTYFRSIGVGWPKSNVDTDYYYTTTVGSWRIIALDSRAGIGDAQRAWLAERLSEDKTTPTVVVSHGPWLRCGNWVDDYRLGDDVTFEMIESAPNVKLVLSGHTHKRRALDTGRTVHAIFPACCYGIDDATGWGAIVLGRDAVAAIFVKELKTTRWGANELAYIKQTGTWSKMPFEAWKAV